MKGKDERKKQEEANLSAFPPHLFGCAALRQELRVEKDVSRGLKSEAESAKAELQRAKLTLQRRQELAGELRKEMRASANRKSDSPELVGGAVLTFLSLFVVVLLNGDPSGAGRERGATSRRSRGAAGPPARPRRCQRRARRPPFAVAAKPRQPTAI